MFVANTAPSKQYINEPRQNKTILFEMKKIFSKKRLRGAGQAH